MNYFSIQCASVNSVAGQEKQMAAELHSIAANVSSVLGKASGNSALKAQMRSVLSNAADDISEQQGTMARLSATLYETAAEYEVVEKQACQQIVCQNFIDRDVSTIYSIANEIGLNSKVAEKNHDFRDTLLKFVGKAGHLGGLVSVVGKTVSSQIDKGEFGVTGAPNIVSLLKDGNSALKGLYKWQKSNDDLEKLARMLPEQAKKTGWKRLLGLNKYTFNEGYISSATKWSTRFKNNVNHADGILDDFTSGGAKSAFAYAGIALSAATNAFSNADEAIKGEISTERAIAETITETLVDTATGWAIGTAVAAGMVATVGAAPVVAVGAATVAVTMGLDWVCEKITGKDLTEAVSDGLIDTALMLKDGAVSVGNAICTGVKEVASGVSNFVQSASKGWNSLKKGFTSLFA